MAKTIRLLTAEDLERLGPDSRCELMDGVLVEMPPVGPTHGQVTIRLGRHLDLHTDAQRLGRIYTEVGFILRRNPDRVRAPDLAFVRADRISGEGPPAGFWEIAPDLVAEVVSPNDTPAEVQTKVREWIEAGVRLVWVVYPSTRTVTVVRSLLDRQELSSGDALEGEDVLPGFSCRVGALFE